MHSVIRLLCLEPGCEIDARYESDVLLDVYSHKRNYYGHGRFFWETSGASTEACHFTKKYRLAVHRGRSERFDRAA
jgi:hypothetical protein